MGLRIYDAFPGKREAQQTAKNLKGLGVQFVQVRPINQDSGRLRWGVFIGGRNSSKF